MISTCPEALFFHRLVLSLGTNRSASSTGVFDSRNFYFFFNILLSSMGEKRLKRHSKRQRHRDRWNCSFFLLPASTIIASAVEKVHEDRTIKSRFFIFFSLQKLVCIVASNSGKEIFDTKISCLKKASSEMCACAHLELHSKVFTSSFFSPQTNRIWAEIN